MTRRLQTLRSRCAVGALALSMLLGAGCDFLDPIRTEDLCNHGDVVSMNCPQCAGPTPAWECPVCQGEYPALGCRDKGQPVSAADGGPDLTEPSTPDTSGAGAPGEPSSEPSAPAGGRGGEAGKPESGASGAEPGPSSDPRSLPGCQDDSECSTNTARPACKLELALCVECTRDEHCSMPGLGICNPEEQRCFECTEDAHCPSNVCDEGQARCVECVTSEDCQDGTNDQCDPERFKCVDCIDDGGCETGACDPEQNACVPCLIDLHCTDPTNGSCDWERRECVDCFMGGGCDPNGELGSCDEERRTCVDCVDDSGCPSDRPVCDAQTCVECTDGSDCDSGHCVDNRCVECEANDDCSEVGASRCNSSHECAACGSDADCEHLDGTTACYEGRCVECNDDGPCRGRACIRSEHECSDVALRSRSVCQTCQADSMCAEGMNCIPIRFDGRTIGNYCAHRRPRTGCNSLRPYSQDLGAVRSVDGASSAQCGPPATTTCEGVLDVVVGQSGSSCVNETDCGADGIDDALCVSQRCTYSCNGNDNACPSQLSCLSNGTCG